MILPYLIALWCICHYYKTSFLPQVQDLFAGQGVQVNTPHTLKGKSQLEPEVVVADRRVASKRVHVERVIGLAKTFKIIDQELDWTKVPIGGRIIYVCFALVNFRPNIVANHC